MKSKIIELIQNNPDTWRDICKEKHIRVKEEGNLAIFNYDIDVDFPTSLFKKQEEL